MIESDSSISHQSIVMIRLYQVYKILPREINVTDQITEGRKPDCIEWRQGATCNKVAIKIMEEARKPPNQNLVVWPSMHELPQHELVMLVSYGRQHLEKKFEKKKKTISHSKSYMTKGIQTKFTTVKWEKHKQWMFPYRRSNVFIKTPLIFVIKVLWIVKWWLLSTHVINGSVMIWLKEK
jgi:hypothetical protein